MDRIRLNIGAGGSKIPGYTNLDIKDGVSAMKLPYPDGSVDAIYASHVLEHLPYGHVPACLMEWHRALVPGGELRISVPVFEKLASLLGTQLEHMIQPFIMGGQVDEHDRHGALFTKNTLISLLKGTGFELFEEFASTHGDCADHHGEISANVMCHKRRPFPIKTKPLIAACMSQGLLCFSATMQAVANTMRRLDIPLCQVSGAFWDQSLEGAIDEALLLGADYILTVDHDGAFTPDDVLVLLDKMQTDPNAAAVFAVQMSRHDHKPLVFQSHLDYSGEFTRVPFGHFGLTLIRADVFRHPDMARPWFWSIPGPDGKWNSRSRSDADITFWRHMMHMSFPVYQANRVILGHIMQCVRWPTEGGSVFQMVQNYMKKGRPPSVSFSADAFRIADEAASHAPLRVCGVDPPAEAPAPVEKGVPESLSSN